MPESPGLAEEVQPHQDEIRTEQLRHLFGALPMALGISTAVGLLLVAALWRALPAPLLLGWLLAHLTVSGGRLALLRAYRRQAPLAAEDRRCRILFLVGAFVSGCVWGAAGVLLFPAGDPLRIAILAVALAGITAGAVTSLSAYWPAALAFIIPTLLPFFLRLIIADLAYSSAVAGMMGLFLVGTGGMSRRIADNVYGNIRLRMVADRRKETLAKYRAAFEQSRDAVMFSDRTGFLDCNPATLELFRVPDVASFISYSPADLSPPHQPDGQPSQEAANERIDEAFAEGQAFFEWRHQTAQGVTFPAEVLLSRVDFDPRPVLQAVVRDISERWEIEQTLRREEAELAEAQRIGRVGSWVWEISAGTQSWSDEIYRIFGVEPHALEATFEAFLRFVHPDDREMVEREVQQVLAGETPYDVEHRIRTPEGEERIVHGRAEVERDAAGQPTRMAGTVHDITERAAAERALRRRADQEAKVQAISTRLLGASGEDLDATLDDALARIGAAAKADRCYLLWIAEDGGTMRATHEWCASGIPSKIEEWQGLPAPATFPWLCERIRNNEVAAVERVGDIPDPELRANLEGAGIRSILAVPLFQGDKLSGLLVFDSVNDEREWAESEQHLIRITTDALANAFARQNLEAKLRHQAAHDPLTGLLNRRQFDELLERETQRADRYNRSLSLVMLDLDHFKAINDTLGHDTGDRVLREVTQRVARRLRGSDVLARLGGEEFMALLPETPEEGAWKVAESLRAEVAGADFPEVGRVTLSLGIAHYHRGEPIKDLTKRVDDALYRAKKAGRNRVATMREKTGETSFGGIARKRPPER